MLSETGIREGVVAVVPRAPATEGDELDTDMLSCRRTEVLSAEVGGGPRPRPWPAVDGRREEEDTDAERVWRVLGPGERAPEREYAEGDIMLDPVAVAGDMGRMERLTERAELDAVGPRAVEEARALREGGRAPSDRLGARDGWDMVDRDGGRAVVGVVDLAREEELVGICEWGVGVP